MPPGMGGMGGAGAGGMPPGFEAMMGGGGGGGMPPGMGGMGGIGGMGGGSMEAGPPMAAQITEPKNDINWEIVLDLFDEGQLVVVMYVMPENSECESLRPDFEELANEFMDQATFAAIDCEKLPETAETAGVTQFPTFAVLHKVRPPSTC